MTVLAACAVSVLLGLVLSELSMRRFERVLRPELRVAGVASLFVHVVKTDGMHTVKAQEWFERFEAAVKQDAETRRQ